MNLKKFHLSLSFLLNQKEKKDEEHEIDNSAAFWKSISADLQESLTLPNLIMLRLNMSMKTFQHI